MRLITLIALCVLFVASSPSASEAQTPEPLEVGALAPNFSLPGATRHGVLAEPVTLGNYEGETVVLAFFFRARTRG